MPLNINKKKNTVVFSFVRYRLPNSAQAFQIYMRKGTKACFKRRATAVLSWFDCCSTAARHQHDCRSTAVLKSNLIRSIEFGTAVARRLKRA